MKNYFWPAITFVMAIVFASLFHRQLIGVNFLIFNLLLIGLASYKLKPKIGNNSFTLNLALNAIAVLFMVLNGSSVSRIMAWVSLCVVLGNILYPSFKSILKIWGSFVINTLNAAKISFLHYIGFSRTGSKVSLFRVVKVALIPILVILGFSLLYKSANPVFDKYYKKFMKNLGEWFGEINGEWIFLFLVGIILCSILFLTSEKAKDYFFRKELNKPDDLGRRRRSNSKYFKFFALKTEYKSALFLFIGLNIILALFNLTDINYLWMGFEWDGGFLKSYVHEGTYILIFSLILSMFVTLYYFRRNLHFIAGNKLLKTLGIIWLGQNILMLFSVGLRNYYYIDHFALAHKRIGVYFFLAVCLIGLISSILKVKNNKSLFFLERINSKSVYILLIAMACFNWDIIIAKYNFNSYKNSYLHLDYMLSLSDKALPYIKVDKKTLDQIDSTQSQSFSFSKRGYYKDIDYEKRLNNRIHLFLKNYKNRSWLSWNYADYKAYHKLKEN